MSIKAAYFPVIEICIEVTVQTDAVVNSTNYPVIIFIVHYVSVVHHGNCVTAVQVTM